MSDAITPQQILQLVISAIGGGLAGSILTAILNNRNQRRAADSKERATISSLTSELRRSNLVCQQNTKLRGEPVAAFIHFPTTVAINATFQERHSYPRLADLQVELEQYTLAVVQINGMIDLYQKMVTSSNTIYAPHDCNRLRDAIAAMCAGESHLEGVSSIDAFIFPEFIDHLLAKVRKL